MTPAERVNQSSGSAAHTVPFLLSRHAPFRVLPTATAHLCAVPRSTRLLTRVLGSCHCVQTYARRRLLIQWSSSPASVSQRPGRKYPPQPRNRLFSSPMTAARLRPLSRAVSFRTFLRNLRRLSAWMPVRVFPMKRVIRKSPAGGRRRSLWGFLRGARDSAEPLPEEVLDKLLDKEGMTFLRSIMETRLEVADVREEDRTDDKVD